MLPRLFALLISMVLGFCNLVLAGDLKPEEIIARHLQSIGLPEARAGSNSRLVEGAASYRLLVGGSGQLQGKAVFASQGRKTHFLLKVLTSQYYGEQFICDGEHTNVSATYSDKTYSDLADFIKAQDVALREGLLGGVLTTAWPLLDLNSRNSKLASHGTKTVDGHELVVVRYVPKKYSDLEILLYFDKESFHHVLTTYTATIAPRIALTDEESAREQEDRYRIEERFSDFQTADGLTLPSHYELRFTKELSHGFTKSVLWEVTGNRVSNNLSFDPRNFQIK